MQTQKKYMPGCRLWLYQKLVERFGAWDKKTWVTTGPIGQTKEYQAYLDNLAEQMTLAYGRKFTGQALALQVKFAVSFQPDWVEHRPQPGSSLSAHVFANKGSAYEAGFIRNRDMPVRLTVSYSKKTSGA